MRDSALAAVLVPAALMILMFGLGLSLEVRDFRKILSAPKILITGVLAQLVWLPAIGLAFAMLSGFEPVFAMGFVVLALCPGGALSNSICHYAGADLALSVALTAVTSLITPFTIPVFFSTAVHLLEMGDLTLTLPIGPTVARLFAVSTLPVVAGLAARRFLGDRVGTLQRPLNVLSVVIFLGLISAVVLQNLGALSSGVTTLGFAALGLNLAAMGSGALLARAIGAPRTACRTLAIELGMQNVAVATYVTLTLLGEASMALPPAVYALVMLPTAMVVGFAFKRRRIKP